MLIEVFIVFVILVFNFYSKVWIFVNGELESRVFCSESIDYGIKIILLGRGGIRFLGVCFGVGFGEGCFLDLEFLCKSSLWFRKL